MYKKGEKTTLSCADGDGCTRVQKPVDFGTKFHFENTLFMDKGVAAFRVLPSSMTQYFETISIVSIPFSFIVSPILLQSVREGRRKLYVLVSYLHSSF